MLAAPEDDMEWEYPVHHPLIHITNLPFDVFLELVKALDVLELLKLRVVREMRPFFLCAPSYFAYRQTCKTLYNYSSSESVSYYSPPLISLSLIS